MKELIIMGGGESAKDCPINIETWCVNSVFKTAERCDKIFFVHDLEELSFSKEDLVKADVPVISKTVIEGVPKSVQFRLDKLLNEFGIKYYVSTISYMLMYAHRLGFERIHLYGVDIKAGVYERLIERSGIEFIIGYLLGKGVEFKIAEGSDLCPIMFYGYKVEVQDK